MTSESVHNKHNSTQHNDRQYIHTYININILSAYIVTIQNMYTRYVCKLTVSHRTETLLNKYVQTDWHKTCLSRGTDYAIQG